MQILLYEDNTNDVKVVDLPSKQKPTVNYNMFSVNGNNIVSVVKGVKLPTTGKNKFNVSPINTGKTKYNVQLKPTFDSSDDECFFGTMIVNSQNFNSTNDEIRVSIYESLGKMFKDMDIGLQDILPDSTFDWRFDDDVSGIPTYSDTGWFLSTADLTGYGSDINNIAGTLVTPARFIEDRSGLFWTISLYNFIKNVVEYYDKSIGFIGSYEVSNDISFEDVYLYFPVQKVAVTEDSLTQRNIHNKVTYDSGEFVVGNDPTAPNNFDQDNIISGKVIATNDGNYELSLYGTFRYETSHQWESPNGWEDVLFFNHADSYVNAILRVFRNEIQVKDIPIGNILDSTDGLNFAGGLSVHQASFGDPIKFYATDEINVQVVLDFNNYEYSDNTAGTTTTLNGIYTIAGAERALNIDGYQPISFFDGTDTDLDLIMVCVDAIVPVVRTNKDGSTKYDTVDVNKSLENLGVDVKKVIQDITKRFNLGFWINSSGGVMWSSFKKRYYDQYGGQQSTSLYDVQGEGYSIRFSDDGVNKFSYKNNYKQAQNLKSKLFNGQEFYYGDVLEYNTGAGSTVTAISLMSGIAHPQLLGEAVFGDFNELIELNDDIRYWGVGNNEHLEARQMPTFFVGFLGEETKFDIRLPRVRDFIVDDSTGEVNSFVTYVPNGSDGDDGGSYETTPVKMRYLKQEDLNNNTLYLGNIETGEIDTATSLYKNFESMINTKDQPVIEIEAIVSHEHIKEFLNGNLLDLYIPELDISDWAILSISGYVFDLEQSIVKIKMKQYDVS